MLRLYRFRYSTHVERVRAWRQAHPGYWRCKRSATPHALQDAFFMQPTMLVGLIAHLTGLSLQDDIATTARRLQQLGRDILCGSPHLTGGIQDAQTPYFIGQTPHSPPPVQLGGSAPGP